MSPRQESLSVSELLTERARAAAAEHQPNPSPLVIFLIIGIYGALRAHGVDEDEAMDHAAGIVANG